MVVVDPGLFIHFFFFSFSLFFPMSSPLFRLVISFFPFPPLLPFVCCEIYAGFQVLLPWSFAPYNPIPHFFLFTPHISSPLFDIPLHRTRLLPLLCPSCRCMLPPGPYPPLPDTPVLHSILPAFCLLSIAVFLFSKSPPPCEIFEETTLTSLVTCPPHLNPF